MRSASDEVPGWGKPESSPVCGMTSHLGTRSAVSSRGAFSTRGSLRRGGEEMRVHSRGEVRRRTSGPARDRLGGGGCLPHVQIHQGDQPIQGGPWGQGDRVHHLIQKDLVCRVHPKEQSKVGGQM